eukprot:8030507-Lingulodinium_polyedra.AAC.1
MLGATLEEPNLVRQICADGVPDIPGDVHKRNIRLAQRENTLTTRPVVASPCRPEATQRGLAGDYLARQ